MTDTTTENPLADFELDGVFDFTTQRGPARLEGESDEELLARIERESKESDHAA